MGSFFKTNCRNEWSDHYCDLGNICALFSKIIGFTAILPQIYQIWNYQSVDALHVLWPTALVTAAISNAFFIFATEDRSFFKITAIYNPILYMIFVIEFWIFTNKNAQRKMSYAAMCIILWASLLTIELTVNSLNGPKQLEWISVVIYSVKVLPQMILNIQLRTTFGQSTMSVFLYCLVSSFAFTSAYLLQVDLKYRIMHYLSSSLAYINAIQVIWYPRPVVKKHQQIRYGTIIDSQDYSVPPEERITVVEETTEEIVPITPAFTEMELSKLSSSYGSSLGRSQTINVLGYFQRLKEKSWWQLLFLLFLLSGLVLFTVGLSITVNTFWTVFGPVSMFGLLFITSLYRDYKEGSLSFYCLTELRYKIYGESL
ncbi:uncharacterized protein LOC130655019 [Hydractinia symbiolongicarpus]|uniref:uncharacterized protein LOC130655019 n=1 Tax=Hydractinia symbiolongicarpus TaxID=13093 RepID=UPI00254D3836|nr:uncharacterized protein LOC130655019 [Hydractinia symbiolongicarpus]